MHSSSPLRTIGGGSAFAAPQPSSSGGGNATPIGSRGGYGTSTPTRRRTTSVGASNRAAAGSNLEGSMTLGSPSFVVGTPLLSGYGSAAASPIPAFGSSSPRGGGMGGVGIQQQVQQQLRIRTGTPTSAMSSSQHYSGRQQQQQQQQQQYYGGGQGQQQQQGGAASAFNVTTVASNNTVSMRTGTPPSSSQPHYQQRQRTATPTGGAAYQQQQQMASSMRNLSPSTRLQRDRDREQQQYMNNTNAPHQMEDRRMAATVNGNLASLLAANVLTTTAAPSSASASRRGGTRSGSGSAGSGAAVQQQYSHHHHHQHGLNNNNANPLASSPVQSNNSLQHNRQHSFEALAAAANSGSPTNAQRRPSAVSHASSFAHSNSTGSRGGGGGDRNTNGNVGSMSELAGHFEASLAGGADGVPANVQYYSNNNGGHNNNTSNNASQQQQQQQYQQYMMGGGGGSSPTPIYQYSAAQQQQMQQMQQQQSFYQLGSPHSYTPVNGGGSASGLATPITHVRMTAGSARRTQYIGTAFNSVLSASSTPTQQSLGTPPASGGAAYGYGYHHGSSFDGSAGGGPAMIPHVLSGSFSSASGLSSPVAPNHYGRGGYYQHSNVPSLAATPVGNHHAPHGLSQSYSGTSYTSATGAGGRQAPAAGPPTARGIARELLDESVGSGASNDGSDASSSPPNAAGGTRAPPAAASSSTVQQQRAAIASSPSSSPVAIRAPTHSQQQQHQPSAAGVRRGNSETTQRSDGSRGGAAAARHRDPMAATHSGGVFTAAPLDAVLASSQNQYQLARQNSHGHHHHHTRERGDPLAATTGSISTAALPPSRPSTFEQQQTRQRPPSVVMSPSAALSSPVGAARTGTPRRTSSATANNSGGRLHREQQQATAHSQQYLPSRPAAASSTSPTPSQRNATASATAAARRASPVPTTRAPPTAAAAAAPSTSSSAATDPYQQQQQQHRTLAAPTIANTEQTNASANSVNPYASKIVSATSRTLLSHFVHRWANNHQENQACYKENGYLNVKPGMQLLSRYVLIAKLGWGEFSTVWLAYDKRTTEQRNTFVAVKIAKCGASVTESTKYEIALLSFLKKMLPRGSPATPLANSFEHKGEFGVHQCMVMPLCGSNLLCIIDSMKAKKERRREKEMNMVKEITTCILQGLVDLERENIIHTDLKPENILCASPDPKIVSLIHSFVQRNAPNIKNLDTSQPVQLGDPSHLVNLADFGLSVLVEPQLPLATAGTSEDGSPLYVNADGSPLSERQRAVRDVGAKRSFRVSRAGVVSNSNGVLIQTREYRAPEILLGCDFNARTDVWSVGCIVYELITGDFLLDPKRKTSVEREMDVEHLAMVMQILGPSRCASPARPAAATPRAPLAIWADTFRKTDSFCTLKSTESTPADRSRPSWNGFWSLRRRSGARSSS